MIINQTLKTELKPKQNFIQKHLTKILLIVTLLAIAVAAFSVYRMQTGSDDSTNPDAKLISEVSEIIELPEGTPVIATVEDASKVKDQAFFKNAKNGDKVLAYIQLKKAYLYRPSTKKIIEVGPILISTTENQQ